MGRDMIFDDEFIQSLPQGHISGAKGICRRFLDFHNSMKNSEERVNKFETYLRAVGCARAFGEAHGLKVDVPPLVGELGACQHHVDKIVEFFEKWMRELNREETKEIVEMARRHYTTVFGTGFAYEFSEGDFDKVQRLVNELRDLIRKSEAFEDEHRSRLLRKLERLQLELHKRMSSLDVFWGLIGDAGVVLGKLGEDAKPFVDRIREIAGIVWRTQAGAESIAGEFPLKLLGGSQDRSVQKHVGSKNGGPE